MSEIRTACNKDIYDIYTEKAVSRIQVFIFSKPLSENCFFLFLSYLLQSASFISFVILRCLLKISSLHLFRSIERALFVTANQTTYQLLSSEYDDTKANC